MRRSRRPAVLLLFTAGCTFTSGTAEGLPGVAGSSSDQARAQFAAVMIGHVRVALESWGAALRGQSERALQEHYARDAAVVQSGSDLVKGAEALQAMASSLGARVDAGHASLLDVEVSEGIAYVYGAYDLTSGGMTASRGYLATVLRQSRSEWLIRTQLFDARAGSAALYGVPGDSEVGVIHLGTTASGSVPREAFAAAVTLMAGFSRAWGEQDAAWLRRAFTDGALLQLPDAEVAARGHAVAAAVEGALARWTSLETTELDFTASGRLAVLLGRYELGAGGEPGPSGHYLLVFARDGTAWKIRSLILG